MTKINSFDKNKVIPIKPKETDDELIERLAKLSTLDYEKVRAKEAEILGVRTSILDKMIKAEQMQKDNFSIVEELEPWAEEVDINEVLTEIKQAINNYAILPRGADNAISLWIVSSYSINAFNIYPKLIIFSPEKRCGKSTVLDIVEGLTNKSLFTSNISVSAIFRVISKHQPTLLIDEADTFIANRNDEMIGIINSGHAKNRAFIIRSEGDNFEPTKFSTWAPMVLASIKALQGTIMDRGIKIELRRKTTVEKVERLRHEFNQNNKVIRCKLLRWASDNFSRIQMEQIEPPCIGNDRAIDNWLPLFTVAKLAGVEWVKLVNSSYLLLESKEETPTPSIMLLEDIRGIFNAMRPVGKEEDKYISKKAIRISSEELTNKLITLEERPWIEWRRGQPMTQNTLAKLLGSFNIKSSQMRIYGTKTRGYEEGYFLDSFTRYLTPLP